MVAAPSKLKKIILVLLPLLNHCIV